jgi:hypothetical protein
LLKIFSFEVVTKKQSGKLEKQCEWLFLRSDVQVLIKSTAKLRSQRSILEIYTHISP